MNSEIRRQILESDRQHFEEYDSMILYVLSHEFGFGKKRLRRFYVSFHEIYEELKDKYCMEDSDVPFICKYKLKEQGVDIEEWSKEVLGEEK